MLSERSERRDGAEGELGAVESRERVASTLRARGVAVDADRIAIAPSGAAIALALFYVLADPGDEALVLSDGVAADAATISGLDVTMLRTLDANALFEAAGARTRAIVLDAAHVDADVLAVLAELDVALVCVGVAPPVAVHENAPLLLVVGTSVDVAWLAVLGPADRAEPLLARLALHAHVFFAQTGA